MTATPPPPRKGYKEEIEDILAETEELPHKGKSETPLEDRTVTLSGKSFWGYLFFRDISDEEKEVTSFLRLRYNAYGHRDADYLGRKIGRTAVNAFAGLSSVYAAHLFLNGNVKGFLLAGVVSACAWLVAGDSYNQYKTK